MGSHKQLLLLLWLLLPMVWPTRCAGQGESLLGESTWELPTTDGRTVALTADPNAQLTVVGFLGVECPLAKLYAPRLVKLAEEFSSRSVRFIGVNSNRQDSMQELAEYRTNYRIPFDCCKDYDNILADRFRVQRTPEVIVIDQNGNIQYRGRIDDQYSPGIVRSEVQREDLKIALEELLAGQPVRVSRTEPEGCLLGRVKQPAANATVTFANQISRIFRQHCVECHRAGEIGPFVLDQYDEAAGWADMIVETIENGRMPPWHADPAHRIGRFLNERRMAETDKQLVRQWVADGTPFGDAAELPPPVEYVSSWRLPRQPDLVVPMRERPFTVPADGSVEYQYFVVDPGFSEDKWVAAAEVMPGNRSVVHHSIVFIRPPDGTRLPGVGWLAAYVPGQRNLEFAAHRARRVPAGSKLVFQQHYTPTGSQQSDVTKVGLIFADQQQVTEELLTLIALNQQFEIPPHEPRHTVTATADWFPENGRLLSVSPHMHYRGKSFEAELATVESTQSLLRVPQYDFNWQHSYQFAQPISLADARQLSVAVTFDNSPDNPWNPDPNQRVTWGDQSWEEMAIGFFDVAVPRGQPLQITRNPADDPSPAEDAAAVEKKIDQFVDDFFQRFDSNRDGRIMRSELPISIAKWTYDNYETDGVAGLSPAEIRQQAESRFR